MVNGLKISAHIATKPRKYEQRSYVLSQTLEVLPRKLQGPGVLQRKIQGPEVLHRKLQGPEILHRKGHMR